MPALVNTMRPISVVSLGCVKNSGSIIVSLMIPKPLLLCGTATTIPARAKMTIIRKCPGLEIMPMPPMALCGRCFLVGWILRLAVR